MAGRVPVLDQRLRLILARESADMTQAELAREIEASRTTVSNYERAAHAPKRSTLILWALATGVDLHWLETGEAPSPDGDGASDVVRPKGFEPLTSCSGTGVVVACDFGRPAVAAVSSSVGAA